MLEGKVLELDAPNRLVTTFSSRFGNGCDDTTVNDRPSRVTWLIEKRGDVCKLTLTHDDFDGETATFKSVGTGWNEVDPKIWTRG